MKHKIVFTPSGKRGEFVEGTPVLQAARSLGVDLDSVCGGRGKCGRCQVTPTLGEFAKHGLESKQDHLSAFNAVEERYTSISKNLADGRRLSCQAQILGDMVIDVPPESQMHRQLVRKEAEHRDITLDPAVRLYFIEVEQPTLDDASGDLERVYDAMRKEWHKPDLTIATPLLAQLQSILREGDWQVTVAVHKDEKIIAMWSGFKRDVYGVAIDIGSTTIAAHLCSLSTGEVLGTGGIMNPQIRFGEDLMSRVSYVMMQPEGAAEMTTVVREGINQLLHSMCADIDLAPADIVDITIAGNPIMHHIFLGISPIELGGAPFALAVDTALDISASELDLSVNPGAMVYVMPCIAGHVGADAAAMVLSDAPHLQEQVSIVVDVGTNAEIVLGNQNKLYACSSPTGPAFEGAQISCGQRAAPGAIERVRIDPETLEVRFSVIGSDTWSDQDGFDAVVEEFGVTGICGSGIIEAVAQMYLAGVISADGVVDGSLAARTNRIYADDRTFSFTLYEGEQRIVVTQNDVRQIQLAKAALYAGIKLLLDHAGLEKVDRISLAGAFGSHIDTKYAMVLGLIPDCELDQVGSIGNAAGTGARIALLNSATRTELENLVKNIEKIETATEPRFQEYFIDAMAIPNKRDAFPELFKVVTKPFEKQVQEGNNKPRRRRRKRKA